MNSNNGTFKVGTLLTAVDLLTQQRIFTHAVVQEVSEWEFPLAE